MQCPNCGNELKNESKFCKYCGNPVIQDKVKKQDINNTDILSEEKCVKCGNSIVPGNAFCIHCGTAVSNGNQTRKVAFEQSSVQEKQKTEKKSGKKFLKIFLIVTLFIAIILLVVVFIYMKKDSQKEVAENVQSALSELPKDENEVLAGKEDAMNVNLSESFSEESSENTENSISSESEEIVEPLDESHVENTVKEYILPDSNIRYISKSELSGLTAEECRLARNELYARHGRKFDDEGLQNYFNSFDWYTPTIEGKDFEESMLNEYEVANRDLIVEYEKELGYRFSMNNITNISATSSLAEQNMIHSPERLTDGDISTAWVEGVDGQGIGQTVKFSFDRSYYLKGITIRAGYQKNEDVYAKNSRPKDVTITYSDGSSEQHTLQDINDVQEIILTSNLATDSISVTIESVYAGNKYEDTVITEVSIY